MKGLMPQRGKINNAQVKLVHRVCLLSLQVRRLHCLSVFLDYPTVGINLISYILRIVTESLRLWVWSSCVRSARHSDRFSRLDRPMSESSRKTKRRKRKELSVRSLTTTTKQEEIFSRLRHRFTSHKRLLTAVCCLDNEIPLLPSFLHRESAFWEKSAFCARGDKKAPPFREEGKPIQFISLKGIGQKRERKTF